MQANKRGCAKRSEARGQRRSRSTGLKPTRRQKARAWAEKSVVLLDQYDESGVLQRQYVQAGSAVFPLDGLPLLNEDTLIAILDIPADERCDWVVQRTNAQCALSYVQDNEENDQLSELAGITFSANGYDLQPVYTPYGLVTIDSSTRRVIADS